MNDDVKAAIEWLRKLRDDSRGVWPPKHPTRKQRFLDVSPDEADALLAHIDGEPARTAAAVAAAREEQREADARFIRSDEATWDSAHELDEVIRTSPLTATPLADRIAELEKEVFTVDDVLRAANTLAEERAEKAEAERDRLAGDALAALAGAGVATPLEGYTAAPFLLKGDIGRLTAERDALRAQVEAARAEGEAIRCGSDCDSSSCYDSECHAARRILAVMDGAKP